MSLQISVNGERIEAVSQVTSIQTPFPALEFQLAGDLPNRPGHRYLFSLVAAPKTELVLYELESESA